MSVCRKETLQGGGGCRGYLEGVALSCRASVWPLVTFPNRQGGCMLGHLSLALEVPALSAAEVCVHVLSCLMEELLIPTFGQGRMRRIGK